MEWALSNRMGIVDFVSVVVAVVVFFLFSLNFSHGSEKKKINKKEKGKKMLLEVRIASVQNIVWNRPTCV